MEFVNSYTNNKKVVEDYLKKCVFKSFGIIGLLMIVFGLCATIGTAISMSQKASEGVASGSHTLLLAVGIVVFILGIAEFLYHKIAASVIMNKIRSSNGGEVPTTIFSFKEKIYQTEGEAEMDYRYDRITRIVETGDAFYLIISKYIGLTILKNAFTEGDSEGFSAFIREKCPTAYYTTKK